MKVSIYIDSTSEQINLIPENDYELDIINNMTNHEYDVSILKGKFGRCYGGYNKFYPHKLYSDDNELILVLEKQEEKK